MNRMPGMQRFVSASVLAVLTVSLLLAGCGEVKSTPVTPGYLREGPAIAQARERRQGDQQRIAEERADAQQRQIAAATQAAVAQATAAQTRPIATPAARSGQISHVVVMWLKKPGDAAARKKLLDLGETFKTIPGVLDVTGGEVVKSDRAVVDSSYDIAFVVTFKDAEGLKGYGPHPVHQKAVEEVVKPNVERYIVYDFVTP
ncbi:Dabb family protein [Humisphaera borealis]|uniref:Dabb family protein n=1 Tax=Humisphaera borealis TaxID=2807512 RepID=A0A7M2WSN6_9BACT|nr:Dabb family protein [Humisphaera borealis]QOV88476.1 Dabb family protein [Humisphaera borealis]